MPFTDRERKLTLVMNPRAGTVPVPSLIESIANELDGVDFEVRLLREREGIVPVVEAAVAGGATDVVAVGGDGTVSGVAGALAGREVNLGIIPSGTANMMARELGIPISVSLAARLLVEDHAIVRIDALDSGTRRFVYQVVIGSGSEVASRISPAEKRLLGRAVYLLIGLRLITDYHPIWVQGSIDGHEVRIWAHQIVIVNAGILGLPTFRWGPGIRPDDGKIEVIAMRGRTRLGFLGTGWDLIFGNYQGSRGLRYYPARGEIVFRTEPSTVIKADGEFVGHTPLRLKVRPGAVRVIVPRARVRDVLP